MFICHFMKTIKDHKMNAAKNKFVSLQTNDHAFTVLEVVMVILLIVIVGATVIPRVMQYGQFEVTTAAGKVAADIRYAQSMATTTQQRSRINFTPPTAYGVFSCASYNNTPGTCSCTSGWAAGTLQANLSDDYPGVVLTGGAVCIEFDALGRPYFNAGCAATGASCNVSAGANVILQAGAETETITVLAETGMVSY